MKQAKKPDKINLQYAGCNELGKIKMPSFEGTFSIWYV